MPGHEDEVRDDLRRFLRQRLDVGEAVWQGQRRHPAGAGSADAPGPGPGDSTRPRSTPAASVPTPVTDSETADSLEKVAQEVSACTLCALHESRRNAVPGVGAPDADLVLIGEGPGAEEDARGEPFVGRAGQLLTKILAAVDLGRDEVFITNVVKCRPPQNRDPLPEEIAACEPYLERQLRLLAPKVICTLGRHAGTTLTGRQESMAALRKGEHSYAGVRLFPTYHPAALLRNPKWKREVWEDIQNVRSEYDRERKKI